MGNGIRQWEKTTGTRAKAKEHERKTTRQNSDKSFQEIDTKKELASIAGVSHDTAQTGEESRPTKGETENRRHLEWLSMRLPVRQVLSLSNFVRIPGILLDPSGRRRYCSHRACGKYPQFQERGNGEICLCSAHFHEWLRAGGQEPYPDEKKWQKRM